MKETTQATTVDRMPWGNLLITLLVVSCEALASNIITPFVTEMCETRFGIPIAYSGFASGILVGSFAFASFLSGFFLGHLSDKFGRKYVMLLGLASGVLCTLWLGVSTTFWLALLSRVISGLTNANIGITKAVISDLAKGKNRAVAYVYQGATFAGMRAVASAASGFLTGAFLFGLSDNPYLLPCVFVAVTNSVGIFVVLVLFKETRKRPSSAPTIEYEKLSEENNGTQIEMLESAMEDESVSIKDDESENSLKVEKTSCCSSIRSTLSNSSFVAGLVGACQDRLTRKVVFVLILNSTMNGCILIAFVLLFTLPISMNGLSFSTFEMGMVYMYLGGTGFLIQVLFANRVNWMGVINTYVSGSFCQFFGTALIPFIPLVYVFFGYSTTTHIVCWIMVLVFVLIVSYGYVSALPVLSTMLANCSSPTQQGLVQGSVQSLACLLRSFGPVVTGFIFSMSLLIDCPFLIFYLIGAGYFISFAFTVFFFTKEDKMICNIGIEDYCALGEVGTKVDIKSLPQVVIVIEEAQMQNPEVEVPQNTLSENQSSNNPETSTTV